MVWTTGKFLFCAFIIMMCGCGDDAASPGGPTLSEQLKGEWEGIDFFVNGEELPVMDNNVFWYFRDTGEFCTQYITAYGGYYTGSSGQVADELSILTENNLHEEAIQWRLSLVSGQDTLRAISVFPDSLSGFEWILVQTGDGPTSSCFSQW